MKNLLQHFIGFEVVFKDNILDKTKITLMDFQNFTNGINFMYILPFSENRALFEPTYFSTKIFKTSIYKKCLVNYLKKNFPGKSYKIKFKEKGILPMFYTKNINHNRNYFQIGISGNWLRASTGYSFQNSFIYAEEITKQLINEKKIKFKNKIIINFLDEIFCNLIKKNPKKFEYIFKCFFFKNSLESIVNFLNGKSNFLQTVIIILSLPKKDLFLSMLGIIKNKFATNENI